MVDREDNVVDLVFKQKLEQQAKIKKAKKRRKRKKISIFLLLILFVYLYWSTDISKPKIITVSGNYVLSKDEVLKTSELNLDDLMIISNPITIKRRLIKHPLINEVDVTWSPLKRYINVNIKEVDVFAYRQDSEGAMMLMFDGSHVDLDSDFYKFMPHLIYIEGFNEVENEKRLITSFQDLDRDIINQISEIHQKSVSFDDNYIELRMNDGNKVYTSFQTVARVNYYFDIITNLKASNTCIIIDEMSGEAYSQPCIEVDVSE